MIHWMNIASFKTKCIALFLLAYFIIFNLSAQQDRFALIEQRLKDLSSQSPGLNMRADLSVSNTTLQEFLKGLAATHDLNLSIDPSLTQRITNYFSDEKVINILLYLAKQYDLDFTFVGSIITISQYKDPLINQPLPPKEIKISFNSFSSNITLDLQDDTLLSVAKKITMLSNKNIVVEPELYNKKITGYIQDLPVQNAL
jgi:type IV pilus assembly protein PilQ